MATKEIFVPGQGMVHFPDTMSDEEIVSAIQGIGGAQQGAGEVNGPPVPEGFGRATGVVASPTGPPAATQYVGQVFGPSGPTLRGPALAGQAIVKGLTQAVGMPGDLGNALVAGAGALGVPEGASRAALRILPGMGLPSSLAIQSAITDPLGLTNSSALTPSGPVETIGTGMLSGGTAALASGPLMGMRALPAAISGLAGGGAASAVDALAPGHPVLGAVAGLLGGLMPAGITAGANIAGKIAGLKQQLAAAPAAGIADRQAAAGARDAFAGEKAAAGTAQQEAAIAANAEHADVVNRANALQDAVRGGDGLSLQEAGTRAQAAARQWLNAAPTRDAERFAGVSVPEGHPTPLTNFESTVDSLANRGEDIRPLMERVTPSLPRDFDRMLKASRQRAEQANAAASALGDDAAPAVPLGDAATWTTANQFRSALGNMLTDPALRMGGDDKSIRALYGAVRQDMSAAAGTAGQGPAFEQAMQAAEAEHQFVEQHLSKVIGTSREAQDTVAPERAAASLLAEGKKGATSLAALRANVPDAVDALRAAHLTPGNGALGADWAGLSPEAKAALIPEPHLHAAMETVASTVSAADAQREAALAAGKQNKNSALAAAQQRRDAALAQVQDSRDSRTLSNTEVRGQLLDTQEAQIKPGTRIEQAILGAIAGGGIPGVPFGLQHLLPGIAHMSPEMALPGIAAGALLGAAAPAAARRVSLIARDPDALRQLGLSGLVGAQDGQRR